ncbi:hypothetical protein CWB85_01335 [Pseudoalteromonas sp. S1727]|uniref:hypothetical protein n=1 Tax=Pseudoalteromonas sp. S1727 TaxID=2066514 RepID=UPI0011080026|nr:hypothetical protein [Pseudoalteromonas sp. S1727]TMN74318.1 hypothetical protein CWB85_01335 [Pseudoalteromonas sp. S1727]
MIRFRLVFAVLLMFAALFSVQATAASSTKVELSQPIVTFQPLIQADLSQLAVKIFDNSTSDTTPFTKKSAADEQPSEGAGFESLQPRLTVSNSSLFLYHTQVEPNYVAIFEFFVPSLARQLYLQPLEPAITLPWFVCYEGKKSRLSGWKDANLQYRAVVTYHS